MNDKPTMREIRISDMSDINKALSLHNTHYGEKRTPAQWNWEYTSNYPELFVFVVLEDEDSIVGTVGIIPIYININGKRYLSGKRENSLLHSKYRGKTWYQQMLRFAYPVCKAKNMHCLWSYTPAFKASRAAGWCVNRNCIYESILILNLRSTLSNFFKSQQRIEKKIILSLLTLLGYSYSLMRGFFYRLANKYRDSNFSIERKLKSTNDLNVLYAQLRDKYPNLIHIDQDEKYLEWRIFNNPNIKYDTYFLYEDSLLRGYCYVSIRDNTVAALTDLTFETAAAGAFLLQNILNNLRRRKVGRVHFLGNVQNTLMIATFNLLRKSGFLKRRRYDYTFVLKNLSCDDENQLYDIKNWYIGGLWTEGYNF
jgi:hypothetical protein